MRVSTRGRYALRLMIDIATHDGDRPVRVKDIAARQQISMKYLEQIISALTKAGYVNSVRGPQGGYRLAMKPEEYTVGMILRESEGDLSPVACANEEYECPNMDDCVTVRLWRELDEAIRSVVDRYTLADLLTWQKGSGQNE